ncbi:hypothetical protein P9112_008235 [Eukaryota sp. TZLM1-RC]
MDTSSSTDDYDRVDLSLDELCDSQEENISRLHQRIRDHLRSSQALPVSHHQNVPGSSEYIINSYRQKLFSTLVDRHTLTLQHEKEVTDLKSIINSQQSEIQRLTAIIDDSHTKSAQLMDHSTELNAQLSEARSFAEDVEFQLKQTNVEKDRERREFFNCSQAISELMTSFSDVVNSRIDRIESRLSSVNQATSIESSWFPALRDRLLFLESDLNQVSQEVRILKNERDSCLTQLDESRDLIGKTRGANGYLEKENVDLIEQNESYKKRISILERKISDLNDELILQKDEMNTEIQWLRSKMAKLKKERNSLVEYIELIEEK